MRLATSALFFAAAGLAVAAQDGEIRRIDADLERTAIPGIGGVSSAMLIGAFDAGGLYAASGRLQKGSRFPPHSHPDQRLTVVLSGTMYLGEGETFSEDALVAYPAGTAAITPPGTPHFMSAPDGEVVVLEIGSGPSGATFHE